MGKEAESAFCGGAAAPGRRWGGGEAFYGDAQRLVDADGGLISCFFVDREIRRFLTRAAALGNGEATAYIGAVEEYDHALGSIGSRRAGALCLACDSGRFFRLQRPAIVVVVTREDIPTESCAVAGVCERCAQGTGWPQRDWKSGIIAAIEPQLARLWPRLRRVQLHAAGSA